MASAAPTAEIIREPGFGPPPVQNDNFEQHLLRRQRIKLFLIVFSITLLVGLTINWLRPEVYQSAGLLKIYNAQSGSTDIAELPREQLVIHQQRLVSHRLFAQLSAQLRERHAIAVTVEELTGLLRVEAVPDSRLLQLVARGNDPGLLQPALDAWLAVYAQQYAEDNAATSSDERHALQQQLDSLTQKQQGQHDALQKFREAHNIISLERDESRVLSKMKSLGAALDAAVEEETGARAEIAAIKSARASGVTLERPGDRAGLESLEGEAATLQQQLQEFSEKYTQAYMDFDPNIKAIKQRYDRLVKQIQQRRARSQVAYLEESSQALSIAREKQKSYRAQLAELQDKVQQYSRRLEEYKTLSKALETLELEAETLRAELLQHEVRRPYQTRIQVLEQPHPPGPPVAPLYWRDAGLILFGSLLLAALAAALHLMLTRTSQPAVAVTNYPMFAQLSNQPGEAPAGRLRQQSAPLQVGHADAEKQAAAAPAGALRELSENELSTLLEAANSKVALAIGLTLCGIKAEELLQPDILAFDTEQSRLTVLGATPRELNLPGKLQTLYQAVGGDAGLETLWRDSESGSADTLNTLVSCAAHDAGLSQPDALTLEDIRHSYLAYLARCGLRLSELETIAGGLEPLQLGMYRNYRPPGPGKPAADVVLIYPLLDMA